MALEHFLLEAKEIISFVAVRSYEIISLASRKSYSNVTLLQTFLENNFQFLNCNMNMFW